MTLQLHDNIRAYRLERGWTQQQLAEAMEVSIGAVSKWEGGQSRPELDTLMRLAALFDVSTDALLGHQSGILAAADAAERIKTLCIDKQYARGVELVEMALLKHPNDFRVAYESALLFRRIQMEQQDRAAGERSLQLFERAAMLLPGAPGQGVSQQSLQAERALVLTHMGELAQALQLYRESNVNGVNDVSIGSLLFQMGRYADALEPLSRAYLSALSELFNSLIHLGQSLMNLGRAEEGLGVFHFMEQVMLPLVREETPSYVDRMLCVLQAVRGGMHLHLGREEEAEQALRAAIHYARRYDTSPNPYGEAIPFYHGPHRSLSDRMGGSLEEGITRELQHGYASQGHEALYQLWLRIQQEEAHEDA